MADCQEGTETHNKITALIRSKKPDFSIYGGDICSSGAYRSFKYEFFTGPELDLISRVPFFLSPGNHEGWSDNTKAFTRPPDSSSGTPEYYSFDRGAAHFLILNTETDFSRESRQYKFAVSDLANTKKKWKIAVFHKPAYAQGGDWFGEPNPTRALADAVLSPGGVQLVFSGHMHYYQHNYAHGTHYLVVSPAGGYQEDPVSDSWTVSGHKGFHFAIADVDSLSLCVRIYSETGELVDTVSLRDSVKK
jgi:predicted phosphodiesterase